LGDHLIAGILHRKANSGEGSSPGREFPWD
jgi:hypothetical protein